MTGPARPARATRLVRCVPLLLAGWLAAGALASGQESPRTVTPLFNPYERPKNGPPLTNLFHKAHPGWIRKKLLQPRHHPSARMPDLHLTEAEVVRIMAYLRSIADRDVPAMAWPAWASRGLEDLEADEEALEQAFDLMERGQALWGRARCSICHRTNNPVANDPRGPYIGGVVDLRTGGMDLDAAAAKLRRDWLYRWIEDPKIYFPHTLMPRFRFSDAEIRALVEYLLRDTQFGALQPSGAEPIPEESAREDPTLVEEGRRLIELSRCILCHDIRGIPEVLPAIPPAPPPAAGTFQALAWDLRCLTCHRVAGRGGTYAPDLTGEGSRLAKEWIARFVHSPDTIRPLSEQMPRFNLTPQEAATIADYIATALVDPQVPAEVPDASTAADAEISRGRELFVTRGCVACHTSGEGPGGAVGPSLDSVADRLLPGFLFAHLRAPHRINPASAEPALALSAEEARSLALYLATKKGRK